MNTQPNETPTETENTAPRMRGADLPNAEPIPGPEPSPAATDTPTAAEPPAPEPETGSAAEKRYRLQLREAEAERDSLRSVVESMRTAEVERLAGDRLVSSKLLWTLGKTPADLLTDDGTAVDPKKVDALCSAVVDAYGAGVAPHVRSNGVVARTGGVYAPLEGRRAKGSPAGTGSGMEKALRPDALDSVG